MRGECHFSSSLTSERILQVMFSVQNMPHLHQGFSWFPISMEGCKKREHHSEEYMDHHMAGILHRVHFSSVEEEAPHIYGPAQVLLVQPRPQSKLLLSLR